MALRARYLRTILGITALAGVWALFTFPISSPISTLKQTTLKSSFFKPTSSLRDNINAEEEQYQIAIQEREALVKLYGPSPEDVDAFPHRQLYTLWDFFIPAFRCPHRVQRIGVLGDGGKWFCGLKQLSQQRAPCVIYSFGINGESSFEAAVLTAAPQCEIWGYDFSVNAFGPEIETIPDLQARSHFFPYALGSEDSPNADPPTFTLQTLMKKNGHTFVDVLKVDVEGAEFDSLKTFVDHFVPWDAPDDVVLPVGQMQLEIHARGSDFKFSKFKR